MPWDWTTHSGACIDVSKFSLPAGVAEEERDEYLSRLDEYMDGCAMVLEGWDARDAEWLGEFPWGWVNYDKQLAYLSLAVEGHADLRVFVWLNDFAYAGLRTSHVIAANEDGITYLQTDGMDVLQRRRDDIIAQLTSSES